MTETGTIGLTTISGHTGTAIEVFQWLNGEGFAPWEHSLILLPGNMILEAEPGGARIVPMHYAQVYWCHSLRRLLPASLDDTVWMRVAESFRGVGYSFLDYGALTAHRLHVPVPGLREYYYLRLAGHIFEDGRWPGDVTPASLYRRDLELMLRGQDE